MFVGEAPGFHEDKQGVPFVGAAGKLLGKLLEGIGLTREGVYIANVIMCCPPGNRDPQPEEIESCEPHLWKQIELIQPALIATLGNFATKLLSGKPNGITQVHIREQQVVLGGNEVTLYPIFHPAAALYTPRMLNVLEEDFARIPALLGRTVSRSPRRPHPSSGRRLSRPSSASSNLRGMSRSPALPTRPRRSPPHWRATLERATSSQSPVSWGRARPRSSAVPRARSVSPSRCRAPPSRSVIATRPRFPSPTSTSIALPGSIPRSGGIWSRTSTGRSRSSNGPSAAVGGSPSPVRPLRSRT